MNPKLKLKYTMQQPKGTVGEQIERWDVPDKGMTLVKVRFPNMECFWFLEHQLEAVTGYDPEV